MEVDVSPVAALFADRARAVVLSMLLSGRAHTAGELARAAGVAASTMSAHLLRLEQAGAVAHEAQGRHRYYRLADTRLAAVWETLAAAAPPPTPNSLGTWRRSRHLKQARTCYDHLAGELGVAIARSLLQSGRLVPEGPDYRLTPAGAGFFAGLGIDVAASRARRRRFAFPCLDWSERAHHLAGALGAALLELGIDGAGWFERRPDTRALRVTPAGRQALAEHFGVAVEPTG